MGALVCILRNIAVYVCFKKETLLVRISAIRIKIERLRKKMYDLALEKGISHQDVLRISQFIDRKLNELQNLNSSNRSD